MKHVPGFYFGTVIEGKYKYCYVGDRPEVVKLFALNNKSEMFTIWEINENLKYNGNPMVKKWVADVNFHDVKKFEKDEAVDHYIFTITWSDGSYSKVRVAKDASHLLSVEKAISCILGE